MAEATMQGVTLFSKARRRPSDVFELALTYDGIEIRRPGEPPRHLSWDRVSEWEIEQRRGGVLLTLRGGGAVTPLVIPRWNVEELDVVLREVTSHAPPVALSDSPRFSEEVRSAGLEAAPLRASPQPGGVVPEQLARAPEEHAAPKDPAEGPLVWPGEAPLKEIPSLSWPSSMSEPGATAALSAEFVLPDEPRAAEAAQGDGPASPTLVAPAVVRTPPPANKPLPVEPVVDVLALVDDVLAAPESDVVPEVAVGPDALVAPPIRSPNTPAPVRKTVVKPPVATPTRAPVSPRPAQPVAPDPESAAIFIPPREGVPEPGTQPRATVREERRTEKKQKRRLSERAKAARQFSWRVAATVVLLGALALAVALVLAQSAGLIHLPFFGSPA